MIVVKPISLNTTSFTSSDVHEVAPAVYSAGTTYGNGDYATVLVGTLGQQDIYMSLQAGNIGHTPSSSAGWWVLSSTVYEPYNAGSTYAVAHRVQDNTNHKVYQSLIAGNNNQPLSDATKWSYVGPTNRYKALDTSNSTKTAKALSMSFVFTPGQALSVVALLGLVGCLTARVRLIDSVYGTVYDSTTDMGALPTTPSWWHFWFGSRTYRSNLVLQALPTFPNAVLYVDLTGTAALALSVLAAGQAQTIGNSVNYGAKVGIRNFSVIETNAYGDDVLVVRSFAKRGSFTVTLAKTEVDATQEYLADLRATPCLFIGSDCYQSTIIFGFYQDFDILIERYSTSECSIEIKGMT